MSAMILITGAHGMMGAYVRQTYEGQELCLAGRDTFDICNYPQGRDLFARIKPRLVIHLAAETNVDLCEQQPDHAFRVNVVGTQNVARLCAEHGAEMLFVSTTGIFGGTKPDEYTEFDEPAPVNHYGMTKCQGERIVRQLCPRSYILRAGWVFGGGPERDKKFVGKMVSLCVENAEIRVVDDKVGSPTYAADFVANARLVAESGYYGTYLLTGIGAATRHDIACEIVRILKLKTKIIPVSSAVFPLPAPRPRNDSARNLHLELLGLNRMRPWQEALAEYLRDWPLKESG